MTYQEYHELMNENEDGETPAFARKTSFKDHAVNRLDSPQDLREKQKRKNDMEVTNMFGNKEEY